MKLFFNKKKKLFIFLILFSLALISIVHSFKQAQLYSFDFTISTAKLTSEGVNHYQYVLDGKHDRSPNDRILHSQDGHYAHGIHILLIPFTWLSWDMAKFTWALVNIIFSFAIIYLLYWRFNLSKELIFVCACIFLMSTPYRINISYGQHTLFTFLFFIFPFVFKNKLSIFFSGLSYFKYNIGYVIFIYFVSLLNIKKILISLIACFLGWLFHSYLTNSNIFENLFAPIRALFYFLPIENYLPVTIFSLLKTIGLPVFLTIAIPLTLSFFVIYRLRAVKDELLKLSIVSLTCLSFAAHQLHDYILLLPLLVFSLKNISLTISKINIVLIFYFFFFLRILSYFFGFQPWDFPYGYFGYLNNFLTISVFFININFLLFNPKKNINFLKFN